MMILSAFYEAIMARITNYYVSVTNTATSTTSNAISIGSKIFTTQAGLSYAVGNRIRFANDATRYMDGIITSYVGTTLIATIDITFGGGTFTAWNIGIAVPVIKHFDIYYRQDEQKEQEDELPFQTPAVLFEYEPMEWETIGNSKQITEAIFNLHVINNVVQEMDNRTSQTIRNIGYNHLSQLDNIFYFLHGYNCVGSGTISRIGLPEIYQPNGEWIKHIIKFKCRLTDIAAVISLVPAIPAQDLTVVVVNEVPTGSDILIIPS